MKIEPYKKVKQITTTTKMNYELTARMIRQAFDLPDNARVFFHIPGGADWSNTDMELDDLTVLSVETKTTEVFEEE